MDLFTFLASWASILGIGLAFFQSIEKQVKNKPVKWYHVLISSAIVTILVFGFRYLGMLRNAELSLYDQMMRLRLPEGRDPRITVVTINDSDIKYQIERGLGMRGSLSDVALEELLNKINRYNPRTIGLDIYHDYPFASNTLAKQAENSTNLFTICKVPSNQNEGVEPIPDFPKKRVGFSDFKSDPDGILRRHLLIMEKRQEYKEGECRANLAFSFLSSLDYLSQEESGGYQAKFNKNGECVIGETVFRKLKLPFSGYQKGYRKLDSKDTDGYQLMLNYRAFNDHADIVPTISLEAILEESDRSTLKRFIEDKIILIGVDNIIRDSWLTTNNIRQPNNQSEIPGVFIQAHMISQIISAVLDKRSLIWAFPIIWEFVWILIWALVGGLIVWKWPNPFLRVTFGGVALFVLFGLCLIFLMFGGWIPFVPAVLSFSLTGVSPFLYLMLRPQPNRNQQV